MSDSVNTQNTETVSRVADLLLEARKTGVKLNGLPKDIFPKSTDEAFKIQLAVAKELGEKIAGYKVSMSGGSPMAGIILESGVLQSPANWPKKAGVRVETEIAVIIGDAGPGKPGEVTPEAARDLVCAIASGVEILESRYIAQGRLLSPLERCADSLSGGGYVVGPSVADWQSIDLSERHLTMRVLREGEDMLLFNEKLRHPHPGGGPFASLAWLAGYLPTHGLRLEPGQLVTTGSYSGAHPVIGGDEVEVEFEGLPEVSVKIGTTGHW